MPEVKEQYQVRSGNGTLIVMTFDTVIEASNWMMKQKQKFKTFCPTYRLFRSVTTITEVGA